MTTDVEIDRALATVTATLNDQQVEQLETARIQEIVDAALGGERKLTVDDGGGLHDESDAPPDDTRTAQSGDAGRRARGRRVGAVRRTDSGEWIAERQNDLAERSDTAVPSPPPQGKLRGLLTKLKVLGP